MNRTHDLGLGLKVMNEVEEVSRELELGLGLRLGLFKVINEVEEFSRESR